MDDRICAQLYNIREFCQTKDALSDSLAKLSKIGYKTIQISGIGPIDAKDVKEVADKNNMEIMLTHMAGAKYEDELEKVIEDHHILGAKVAGLGSMADKYRSAEGVKLFVEKFNKIADEISKNGLTFAYHNHSFEFYKENGKSLMDYILENTDPDKFKLVVDVYWLAYAGINPENFLKKYSNRLAVVHFKDLKMKLDNSSAMCEIGEGNLNWDEIISASRKSTATCAAVELDNSDKDQFESFKISYDYLKTKGFC